MTSPYEIKIVQVEPRRLAAVSASAPFDNLAPTIMALMDVIWGFIRSRNITGTGHNVIKYDTHGLTEVGVQVDEDVPGGTRVVMSATPAGRAATTVHWGSYDGLKDASQAIVAWCAANGHALAGESWEVYGDWSDDPEKVRTDVFFLLEPSS
jgi:effector-binding domain-containing protein